MADLRIGVVDKCTNRVNYAKHFGFPVDVLHMSSNKVQRLKVADIDLEVEFKDYDYVILIGSEAMKRYSRHTAVGNYTGKRVDPNDKHGQGYKNFLCSISPAMLFIKPEMQPVFDKTVQDIANIINGTTKPKAPVDYRLIDTTKECNDYLRHILELPVEEFPTFAFDTETTGLYARKCYLLGASISHKVHQGVYIDANCMDEDSYDLMQTIIDTPKRNIVLHNLKFDMHILRYHLGLNFEKAHEEKRLHDTMVMHYVLDERQGTHGLKKLAMQYTDMGDYDFALDDFKKTYCKEHKIKQEDFTYDLIPIDTMWPYACLNKDAKVYLEDGLRVPISELVRDKYTGKVLSYNTETGKVEPKQVTGWIKNSHKSGKWKKVEYNFQPKGLQWSKGSLMGPAFTPDHRILTNKGYVEIQDIISGDHKIATNDKRYTEDSLALLMGCLLGDGSLKSRNGKGAGLDFCQCNKHYGFFELVQKAFGGKVTTWSKSNSEGKRLQTEYNHQLTDMYHTLDFLGDTEHQKLELNDKSLPMMTALTLAAWYMSDGNLTRNNCPRIWRRTLSGNIEQQNALLDWVATFGITARFHDDGLNNQFFVIDSANRDKFFKVIAPYITEDMEYKLPLEYRKGSKARLDLGLSDNIYYAEVKSIVDWEAPASRRGYKTSYCLDVEGNRNFLTDIGFVHNCGDTDATLRLFNKFWPILQNNHKLLWLYENVMMPATMFLYRMEDRGLPLSRSRLERANEFLQMKLFNLEKKLYEYPEVQQCELELDKKFNPNSTQQLRHLLFDVLKLTPTGKLTDSGALSTDAEVLEKLGETHPIPKIILEIRKTSKLISSFIVKLLDNRDKDGMIRTNFGCTTTTSGRLSSSGTFNAQQLPRDNPIVKGCVVAPEGYKVVAKDLTTAEMYYAAVLSGDKNLQQVFINMTNEPEKYADFHSTIAHMVFKLPCAPNDVKKLFPAMRQASKAVSFGILFGSGKASVAESINIALLEQSLDTGEPFVPCTPAQAQEHIDTYFRMFKDLKKWIDKSHDQIKQCGFIYSFYGRKRRLRNFRSPDKGVVAGEVRSGFNAIIQGGSSDSFVLSAIAADKEIMASGMDASIIGLVHDSIIAIVKDEQVDAYNEAIDRHVHAQKFNWDKSNGAFEIPGCPIGIESDSEEGGSRDYSCGKMDKAYPFISVYDSPEMQSKASKVLRKYIDNGFDYILELCPQLTNFLEGETTDMDIINKVVKRNKLKVDAKAMAILTYKAEVLESLTEIGIDV